MTEALEFKSNIAFEGMDYHALNAMLNLYDAEGKEVWRVAGGMDWTGEKAGALLRQAPGL